jgi:hypothetical protein
MGLFSKLFGKSKKQKIAELTDQNKQLEAEVTVFRDQQQHNIDKKNSNIPWMDIVHEYYDADKGYVIKLDWNDAHIHWLIDNGINGKDEDTIVQKYLALLYQDQMTKLEDKMISNSSIIHNEFE